jgi:hypothetical protein
MMVWSTVQYQAYNSTVKALLAVNGTLRKRIEADKIWEWGIDAPENRPTIAAGSLTGLTGDYNAKYTYCRRERRTVVCESNPSSAGAAAITLADQDLQVTVTDPTDEQVNAIRIYRTLTGGAIYYLDTTIMYPNGDYGCTYDWEETDAYISGKAFIFTYEGYGKVLDFDIAFTWELDYHEYDSTDYETIRTCVGDRVYFINASWTTSTGANLSIADGSLGSTVVTTHDRPPKGISVAGPAMDGTLFMCYGKRLYYSLSKQPEYWPSTYYLDVTDESDPGKVVLFYDKQPYVITKRKIIYIAGTSHGNFIPYPIHAKTGTASYYGAIAVDGHGIFHAGSDGVYLCIPSTDSDTGADTKISVMYNPIFDGITTSGVLGVSTMSDCILAWWHDKLYFAYRGVGESVPQNVLVFDLVGKKTTYYHYGMGIYHMTVDVQNDRLLAADNSGYVWTIERRGVDTDHGTAIDWEIRSKDYTLQTRAHFPRWTKYDVDASSPGCTATGALYLDGASHQIHALTGLERQTRRRLVTTGNGERCALGISGSGTVAIYAMESE